MSNFTPGKWEFEGTVPFRIKSEASPRIAIVLKPDDARLIAAAPEMYETLATLLEELPIIAGDSRHDALVLAMHEARKLLARIDGEEAHE